MTLGLGGFNVWVVRKVGAVVFSRTVLWKREEAKLGLKWDVGVLRGDLAVGGGEGVYLVGGKGGWLLWEETKRKRAT